MIRISKWVVYELGTRSLTGDDRIDDLVEIVIEVCEANPEFLDPVDAKRHAFFLRAIGGFKPPDWPIYRLGRKDGEPVPTAGELPIKMLPGLLEFWVLSYFAHSHLLPHFALDTADFLLGIAVGVRPREPHAWRIEPLVAKDPPYSNFNRNFKRVFTQRGSGLILIGTVPEGFNVIEDRYDSQLRLQNAVRVASETQFAFKVERCHLSGAWQDCCRIRIEPEFKTGVLGFRFIGNIWPLCDMNQGRNWDERGYFEIPHEWITHEVRGNHENKWTLIPLPTWEIQVEAPVEAPAPPPPVPHSSHVTRVTTTPVQRPIKEKVGVYPVPATPVCAICGMELRPSMLVWKPEQRFCARCKRAKREKT